jgi:hypothetical protein
MESLLGEWRKSPPISPAQPQRAETRHSAGKAAASESPKPVFLKIED